MLHPFNILSEDGAISESEVTGTVASKYGEPRIAKEHVSDTTDYPTPIPPIKKSKQLIGYFFSV